MEWRRLAKIMKCLNRKFEKKAKEIKSDLLNWRNEYSIRAPKISKLTSRNSLSVIFFVKLIFGYYIKQKYINDNNVYIFQGLKNKEYMSIFNPETVVILGGKEERKFAELKGYKFYWSFPFVYALEASVTYGLNFFLIKQIQFWTEFISRIGRTVIFLTEDTQLCGVFLVHIAREFRNKSTTVCIQHGIFYKSQYPLIPEGALSDINFLWNISQAEVIKCNKNQSFEIGLPYDASALNSNQLDIILVGSGGNFDAGNEYFKLLQAYVEISKILKSNGICNVYYRPHPNEWLDKKLVAKIKRLFNLVDDSDKELTLNAAKKIFIGTTSGLLYEAGVSGHLIVCFKINHILTVDVESDFAFNINEYYKLVDWIKNETKQHNYSKLIRFRSSLSPRERFISALRLAKLLN